MTIKNAIIYTGGGSGGTDISDADAAVGDVLAGKTFYSVAEPKKTQVVTIAEGYHNGSGTVQISATEQAKIIAGNIKKDIEILGVTGTHEGGASLPTTGLFTWGGGAIGNGGMVLPLSNVDSDNDWDYVSCGEQHTLAIKNGALYSCGNNFSGRTGLNTTSGYTLTFTQVGSATDWYRVSAGYNHSLGIRKDGSNYTLWVWGEGGQYALGTGATTDLLNPTQIGSDMDWTWISAGYQWSCAIKGGKLYTCGANANYATGQNTSTGNTTTWTNYDGASTGWTNCFAGFAHGLGIRAGELWSWGTNGNGRTGQNTTSGATQIPTIIGADTNWSTASAGYLHSAAIKTTGTLWTFGIGTFGRLGQNNTTQYNVPTQVGSDTDWQDCDCNGNFTTTTQVNSSEYTYAIKGGKLYATGINNLGQIGQPISTAQSLVFVQIGDGTNYIKCSAGSAFGMAIRQT